MKHILVRHEQGAVHAADGYARAQEKLACAWSRPVPAPPIQLPALPQQYGFIPLVFLQDRFHGLIGNDAFQECDITGITRPCTKHNFLVRSIDDLAPTIKEAFNIARWEDRARFWLTCPKM